MRNFTAHILASAAALTAFAAAVPAFAADEPKPALTVSGSVALVSDYRFRGVSQSNNGLAVQGGLTLNHESGAYGGFWASNLAGWGTFGGPNLELDLFAGYKLPVGAGTLDVGGTFYQYPGGATLTSFFEPYAKLSGTAGPVALTAGVAYAWSQSALGNWSNHPQSRSGDKEDNLYLWGDAAFGIQDTPLTLKAHLGYSDGNPGLGPNGTSVAPTGSYFDWLVGADFIVGPVTLGVAYVDTDISKTSAEFLRLQPNFSKLQVPGGDPISSGKVVFSVSAAF
ncbi:MAG: TorF family putative porin [Polymorphobacter sp.]